MYIENRKYVNLKEIGSAVIEIRGVEHGKLAVPVNSTLVHHTAFLTAETRLCVLMLCKRRLYTSYRIFGLPLKYIHNMVNTLIMINREH